MGAQRDGLSGSVHLAYTVTSAGVVQDVEVLSSTNPGRGFDEAAKRAVENWVYAPAMHKGRPVAVRMEVTVEFSPEEKLEQERWKQIELGLAKLAAAQIYPDGAHVAGQNGVSYPAAVKQPGTVYPTGAKIRRLTSRVILLVILDVNGQVVGIPLSRAEETAYPFREAAEEAVRRWRFTPALKEGAPVTAYHWVRLDIPPAEKGPSLRRRP
jgi:TonB family protein